MIVHHALFDDEEAGRYRAALESRVEAMMRWNIAWRMGLGFGIFILAVAVLFVFTRATLTQSANSLRKWTRPWCPVWRRWKTWAKRWRNPESTSATG